MWKAPQNLRLPLILLTASHTQTPASAVEIQRQPLAHWLPNPSSALSHTGHSGQEDALTAEIQGQDTCDLFHFLGVFCRPTWPPLLEHICRVLNCWPLISFIIGYKPLDLCTPNISITGNAVGTRPRTAHLIPKRPGAQLTDGEGLVIFSGLKEGTIYSCKQGGQCCGLFLLCAAENVLLLLLAES